jgi:hypothetical protein
VPTKSWAKFCSRECYRKFHYQHSTKVKNVKAKKQTQDFIYENVAGQIIRKPMEDHVYDPSNVPGVVLIVNKGVLHAHYRHGKLDDRTNYYRGKGIFGYDEHTAIGYDETPEEQEKREKGIVTKEQDKSSIE